jgi:hypothetical protein
MATLFDAQPRAQKAGASLIESDAEVVLLGNARVGFGRFCHRPRDH